MSNIVLSTELIVKWARAGPSICVRITGNYHGYPEYQTTNS